MNNSVREASKNTDELNAGTSRGPKPHHRWKHRRIASGTLPAAAITFCLFTFMYTAIGGYEAPEKPAPLPELAQITPTIEEPTAYKHYPVVASIEASSLPPRLGPVVIDNVDVFIPQVKEIGRAPTRIDYGELLSTKTITVAPARVLKPISGPAAVYPQRLLQRGIEGSCEVRFSVSSRGEPLNIRPNCSHAGFETAAKRAVSKSRFAPEIENGQPVESNNVIYPIEFNLTN